MSLYNSYDRTFFLGEVNFPLDTQLGVLSPAQQRAKLLANIFGYASSGIGYGAGQGGPVTQATSRTTAVTLNKLSGQIKLVSGAGSATAATFTVNNTQINASDTVVLSQASGTDNYELFVTNIVDATSFAITFFTTGGTTTEQPVFNFNIIKGSAS